MVEIGARDAEELAERFVAACNEALAGDDLPLVELLVPGAALTLVAVVAEPLADAGDLVERLARSAWRGDLVLFDVGVDGGEVVAGVAWADEPATRAAEVRLEPDGARVAGVEWVE